MKQHLTTLTAHCIIGLCGVTYAISLEKKNEAVPWGLANSTNPRLGPDAIHQPMGNRQPKCWRELQISSPHFHFTEHPKWNGLPQLIHTGLCQSRDKEPKSSDSLSTQYSSNSSFSMFIGRESLNSAILRVFFSQFMFLAESTLNMWYNS